MTNPADMASGGGHPRRRARLRKEAQALAKEVALAEEYDEFVPTVDDIRSGRFPATTALPIVPPARDFASAGGSSAFSESSPSVASVESADVRPGGAHRGGSRRMVRSGSVSGASSASAVQAAKVGQGKKQPSLAKSGSLASLCVMYGAGIAFVTTMVVSNGIGAAGSGEFFRLMALFAIAI